MTRSTSPSERAELFAYFHSNEGKRSESMLRWQRQYCEAESSDDDDDDDDDEAKSGETFFSAIKPGEMNDNR